MTNSRRVDFLSRIIACTRFILCALLIWNFGPTLAFTTNPLNMPQQLLLQKDYSTGNIQRATAGNKLILSPNLAKSSTSSVLSLALLPFQLEPFALAAFLPTCLGFWRTGYAVSYGYGGAMLASGLLQLSLLRHTVVSSNTAVAHAALYIFYGLRLCLFLLNRELSSPVSVHQMKRRDASLKTRLKRFPVVIGSSVLFFFLAAAPMRVSSGLSGFSTLVTTSSATKALTLNSILALGFGGFLLAAVGDWYKARIKLRDGADTLVTSGPFRYFRHPNYTGEIIGWTASCLLLPVLELVFGLLTNSSSWINTSKRLIPWILVSGLGWFGICFGVLAGEATAGLEKIQKEKYGGTPEYEHWMKTSWSGPMLSPRSNTPAATDPAATQ
mmetsp:Transcript_36436/g.43872  ORF Transcript_36436/g.43872 Transcript_36436/m.43872 type:complete len:384 (+) Transcript_36436:46-1197(+)